MNDSLPSAVSDALLYQEFTQGSGVTALGKKYDVSTNLIRYHLKRYARLMLLPEPVFDVGAEVRPQEYLEQEIEKQRIKSAAMAERRQKNLTLYGKVYADYVGHNKRGKPLTTNQLARKYKVKRQQITLWLHHYRQAMETGEV